MATIATRGPLFRSYKYCQRQAHENPAIFFSIILGALGPLALVVVPPVRKHYFGFKVPKDVPRAYPLPNRPRDTELTGYDDE